MKARIRQGFRSRLLLAVLAVVLGALGLSRSASACTWYLLCLDSAWGWVEGATSATGNWIANAAGDVAQFAVRDAWGNLVTRITCSRRDIGGITGACFPSPSAQLDRMRSAMAFLNADTRADFWRGLLTGPETFQPSSFAISRVGYFIDGNAGEANVYTWGSHPHGEDAVTTVVHTGSSAPVVIWPSAYTNYPDDVGLAGTIVHESDHTRFGYQHSCSDTSDYNEDGPYGTEIGWLGRQALTGNPGVNMPEVDRSFAWQKAVDKLGQICNPAAVDRLWNDELIDRPTDWGGFLSAALDMTWQRAETPSVTSIVVVPGPPRTIYGISPNGGLYQAVGAAAWTPFGSWPGTPLGLTSIAVTPDDQVVYASATDGAVYRTTGGPWVQVATPWVATIAVVKFGTSTKTPFIFGVGGDGVVYLTSPGQGYWTPVTAPWVSSIAVSSTGYIYGVGGDNAVYRTVPDGPWEHVADPAVSSVALTPDGFIYGRGLDWQVYVTRPYDTWQRLTSDPGAVSSISVTPDGFIYGVGTDNAVWVHSTLQPVVP